MGIDRAAIVFGDVGDECRFGDLEAAFATGIDRAAIIARLVLAEDAVIDDQGAFGLDRAAVIGSFVAVEVDVRDGDGRTIVDVHATAVFGIAADDKGVRSGRIGNGNGRIALDFEGVAIFGRLGPITVYGMAV